jgi:hypothetical protein
MRPKSESTWLLMVWMRKTIGMMTIWDEIRIRIVSVSVTMKIVL